jgi:outer membrane immunogenic protein
MLRIAISAGAFFLLSASAFAGGPDAQRWTGTYAGVNAGWGWNNQDTYYNGDTVGGIGGPGSTGLRFFFPEVLFPDPVQGAKPTDTDGFVGGGQLGYNWQADFLVLGVEADLQASDLDGTTSTDGRDSMGRPFSLNSETNLRWLSTARARLGLATGQFLLFATGGVAFGETDNSVSILNQNAFLYNISSIQCPVGPNATCLSGSKSKTNVGWTAGFGFEWAVLRNVSLKTEYLRVDLGDNAVRATGNGSGYIDAKFDNQFDLIRAGLNYKF